MTTAREYRKLAVIMFTDIVGFSTMAQRDEARSLELLEEHNALVRPALAACGGTEIKTLGDAFLVEFGSAVNAVQCAIQLQHMLHDRNAQAHGDQRIELRVGLHLGDVIRTPDDLLGDGVNIAARIQPLADPNGVCVSQQVYDQVRGKLDVTFIEIPKPRMKNIDALIRVYAIRFPWTGQSRGWGERLTEGLRFRLGKFRVVVTLVAGLVIAVGLSFLGESNRLPQAGRVATPRATDPAVAVPPPAQPVTMPEPRPAPATSDPVGSGRGPSGRTGVTPPPPPPTQATSTTRPVQGPLPPEGPVKREISQAEHAQAEIEVLVQRFCAAHESLKVDSIVKMFPLAPVETYRYQFRQYQTLKCSITSKLEYARLDARAAGGAQITFDMKQVVQLRTGGPPEVKETIVSMVLSRTDVQSPWLIDRIAVEDKPK